LSHCLVHRVTHDLISCINLLAVPTENSLTSLLELLGRWTVRCKVPCRVEISFFVRYSFKEQIFTGLLLCFLKQQVVSSGNVVMLIHLNKLVSKFNAI
jgi:hypothetical protein